jgi:hypothetical protein
VNDIKALHRGAMQLVDDSMLARQAGNEREHLSLLKRAFDLERAAADSSCERVDFEPTRSVLHRSAASIALELGDVSSAERLICRALLGSPPENIAEELRDLLEQVYFGRHLLVRGIDLEPDEFQISLAGDAIGYGIAQSDLVLDRIQKTEKLLYRTAERNSGHSYRDRGGVPRVIKKGLELYLSTPRAASFAVSMRLGREQYVLPGFDVARLVTGEFFECLELFNKLDVQGLQKRIPDPAYYLNFVGLARSIAPDGRAVRQVGFTAMRNGKLHVIALTRPQASIPPSLGLLPSAAPDVQEVTLRGRLRAADAVREGHNLIKIVPQQGSAVTVIVPEGMMDDIVRPMWDSEVEIIAKRSGGEITLTEIDQIAEDQE